MTTGSNTSYHFEETPASALSRHSISFSSNAVNSSWDMAPMGGQYGMNDSPSMILPMSLNSNVLNDPGMANIGISSGPFGSDGAMGLKHDTGLAVEWSVEEQYTLEESLVKYVNESSIMKYIRIAATLPDKTIRDVALRCRWMARKRRKQEEHYLGKKVTNRKDKSVESCFKPSQPPVQPFSMFPHPPMMPKNGQSRLTLSDVLSDSAKHFLEQNLDFFDQISANLIAHKFQDNIELFLRAKNNIAEVLNEGMRQMPCMPALSISISEDVINSLMPTMNQYAQAPVGWSSDAHLKQEPRS